MISYDFVLPALVLIQRGEGLDLTQERRVGVRPQELDRILKARNL